MFFDLVLLDMTFILEHTVNGFYMLFGLAIPALHYFLFKNPIYFNYFAKQLNP